MGVDRAVVASVGPLLAERLRLDPPFTATDFIKAYARHNWLRVRIMPPLDMRDASIYGACFRLRGRDRRRYIICRRADGGVEHREWSTWHEAGHIVLGHLAGGDSSLDFGDKSTDRRERDAELFAEIMWVYASAHGLGARLVGTDKILIAFLDDLMG